MREGGTKRGSEREGKGGSRSGRKGGREREGRKEHGGSKEGGIKHMLHIKHMHVHVH